MDLSCSIEMSDVKTLNPLYKIYLFPEGHRELKGLSFSLFCFVLNLEIVFQTDE